MSPKRPPSAGEVAKLKKKRESLLAELRRITYVLRGSYLERFTTCSRPGCRCHQGARHGPRRYLTVAQDGRPRQVYIPRHYASRVQEGIAGYRRILTLLDAITTINLQLLRKGAEDEFEPR